MLIPLRKKERNKNTGTPQQPGVGTAGLVAGQENGIGVAAWRGASRGDRFGIAKANGECRSTSIHKVTPVIGDGILIL